MIYCHVKFISIPAIKDGYLKTLILNFYFKLINNFFIISINYLLFIKYFNNYF